MGNLFDLYLRNMRTKHDIHEHMGVLLGLAATCETIVEFGFRTGNSASAFLASGAKLTSYDIRDCKPHSDNVKKLAGDKFTFIQADTRRADLEIPECDMLFIDSYHSGIQLIDELTLHSHMAKRFIVLHDTQKFWNVGQNGKPPGLGWALAAFEEKNKSWPIKLKFPHCNGLTIMERAWA